MNQPLEINIEKTSSGFMNLSVVIKKHKCPNTAPGRAKGIASSSYILAVNVRTYRNVEMLVFL